MSFREGYYWSWSNFLKKINNEQESIRNIFRSKS
jgi:hypothetical protein